MHETHANVVRAGYTYHLLHVQTHSYQLPRLGLGNADVAGLAFDGQLAFDQREGELELAPVHGIQHTVVRF